ncbi:MAG TPA: serine/threonine-protein kinase, partial [Thermoanaerobaculia bacterium]|nr:serine/threonine-protein kinase [Thermoanaerobaculia bacterium]
MIQVRIDDKYEVIKKLREGGMGAIYLVRHRLLEELRVIKVLRSQLTTDEEIRERFQREARAAIQLRHPNIAQLYDFSIDEEGTAYIVLEFIDGITFEEFAQQPEARHLPLTLALAQQGLRALAYLHRKGFVHRDIAPDNLMLTRDVDGEPLVKLIDLGIVKILRGGGQGTATSLYLGKPKYSSPEQLMSAAIDERSDLYSFGVMLYELVTGLYPIQGHDLPSLLTGHLHREPVSFDVSDPGGTVPESLRRLILRALAKHPEERFASAEEFSRRLGEVAATLTPREQGAERELLDAARAGAQRARAEAIAGAERAVR